MTPLADLKQRYNGGYLGDASIKDNATFQFLSDWGGSVLVKKDEPDVPIVLHGIFDVAFQNYLFTPTSGFQIDKKPWPSQLADHTAFAEAKASIVLHAPDSDTMSDPAKEWESYKNNLTALESLFPGKTVGSAVINNGSGLRLTTRFIIVSTRSQVVTVLTNGVKRRGNSLEKVIVQQAMKIPTTQTRPKTDTTPLTTTKKKKPLPR